MILIGENLNIMSQTLGPALRGRDPGPVQEMAVVLLRVVAFYSLFDASAVATDEETGETFVLSGFPPVGYAFMTDGRGYGGKIGILVGLEVNRAVRGIRIISHQETPGLGAKITQLDFLDQFDGLSTGELAIRRDGGAVDAITAATISSRAVVEGVVQGIVDITTVLEAIGEEGQ